MGLFECNVRKEEEKVTQRKAGEQQRTTERERRA
jgi:hypothetical protein